MGKTKEVKKVFKVLWKIIETVLSIILILISLIIVTQRVSYNEKAFLGYRIFRVQTGSMIPKYQIGDVILVKETDPEELKVGDDVTYEGKEGNFNGVLVTHQIIEIEETDEGTSITTKGIANNKEDPKITTDQINGVVQCRLQILTTITRLLNNGYIFYFCAIIPLTVYFFFAVLKGGNRRARKGRRDEEE